MIAIEPIGFVKNIRTEAVDDNWDDIQSVIELNSEFTEAALHGLDQFSHAEILFHFHLAKDDSIVRCARHPRGNPDWPKVGIFAQRGKDRPNRIGSTIVEIVSVEGNLLTVKGLDAINGTPVIDIKPVMTGFLPREKVEEPAWSQELMSHYW
ncbi:MAG: tRNA (N6-threonylcarbamoyladenosine(37)-N6)-methyltransferase TrmO [Armatimonadota bacterium]